MNTDDSPGDAIASFSGAHPFRPQCVIDSITRDNWGGLDVHSYAVEVAAKIVGLLAVGTCPRCHGPLPDGAPEKPAGSRLTRCRCIPICGPCGTDEGDMQILGQTATSPAWRWPVSRGWMTRRRKAVAAKGRVSKGMIVGDSLLTDDGVSQFTNPRNSGGWAQYGYDDAEDQAERSR